MNLDLASVLIAWNFDPGMTLALVLSTGLYLRGWRRLAARSHGLAIVPVWRAWLYLSGVLTLVMALLSPIDTFDSDLFSVHMFQHLLLIQVAPPLLLLGSPMLPMLWGLPEQERRGVARLVFAPAALARRLGDWLTQPAVAVAAFLLVVGLWHLPPLYDAAQGATLVHVLEHLLFLTAGLLFWWPVVHPSGGRRRLSYGLAIVYLVPPMLEGILIGALLTFAPGPVYATYRLARSASGLLPLQDQQLGGLIMWIPSGMVYVAAIFRVLYLALRYEERSLQARELLEVPAR